ncbi:hypothetical protein QFZ96_006747 [Paraburkholderia youngii]
MILIQVGHRWTGRGRLAPPDRRHGQREGAQRCTGHSRSQGPASFTLGRRVFRWPRVGNESRWSDKDSYLTRMGFHIEPGMTGPGNRAATQVSILGCVKNLQKMKQDSPAVDAGKPARSPHRFRHAQGHGDQRCARGAHGQIRVAATALAGRLPSDRGHAELAAAHGCKSPDGAGCRSSTPGTAVNPVAF